MDKITTTTVELNGKTLTYETGRFAKQAGGSVTVQIGETILLCAATASKEPREGIDFFPLQVEYREKFYAAGRFPGGYFKREARPSEKEVLTARATDRPLRPLFPKDYHNDVQVISLLLSTDGENEPDILSINAGSAALMMSEIPFCGPVGAVRVGRVNGEFILNPTHPEMLESDLDLMYVGNAELPLMIEGSGQEVKEEDLVAAMRYAQPFVKQICEAQVALRREAGLPDKEMPSEPEAPAMVGELRNLIAGDLKEAMTIAGKQERQDRVHAIVEKAKESIKPDDGDLDEDAFMRAFDYLEIEIVRENVLEDGKRIDGRGADDLRPLNAEIGFLPRTHGSAVFSRGETQALATVTLGSNSDVQSMDAVTGGADEKAFMLHYNFPPYSVGETRPIRSTSRREIGHGALAERSLLQMMPESFPYTVRVVSEIMGSNGSSSMATVCVGSLALMDAGVPMKKAVAGISIGLFSNEDKGVLVTDILGAEDHCGDMDFKVAGTRDGVTGFQVDLKIRGLKWDLVEGAFQKAREARGKILDHMAGAIAEPRAEMSDYAPRIHEMKIATDKIGALIGPGGKNIRGITDATGTQIDIEDDGTVRIFSTDRASLEAAIREVDVLTAEPEVGRIYRGKVTGIKDFGAFVEILPGTDGLVHISQLADFHVDQVEDICKMGDPMWVKCIGIDDRGKIKLSRKEALKEKDEDADDASEEA
jgi:polyribonucleotide nucleotidyltransferase